MRAATVIILTLVLVGCGAPRVRVPAPSTVAVARSVEAARESVSRAGKSVATAEAAVAVLEKTATPEQRESVRVVTTALGETTRELEIIRVSLAKGADEALLLQARIDGMASDYGGALDGERAARAATARWRAWALRLALLSAALTGWIFRKPIMMLFLRLCGAPIL